MAVAERERSDVRAPRLERLDPNSLAVLLDVDGTLIEIAPTPMEVRVPPSLKHILAKLRDRLSGALCLVSGRPVAQLDELFYPLRVPIVGGHGAENRLSADGHVTHSGAGLDPELKRRLATIATLTPGLIAEEKSHSLALHYRLIPDQERAVREQIDRVVAELPQDLVEVLPGKAVFEVKPRAFNKGVAIRALMQHPPFAGRRPVFVGDDVTDESAFVVMPEFGGIAVSIGRLLPGADTCLSTPREVRHWLYELLQHGRPSDRWSA